MSRCQDADTNSNKGQKRTQLVVRTSHQHSITFQTYLWHVLQYVHPVLVLNSFLHQSQAQAPLPTIRKHFPAAISCCHSSHFLFPSQFSNLTQLILSLIHDQSQVSVTFGFSDLSLCTIYDSSSCNLSVA